MELGKKQLNYRYFFKSSLGLTLKLVSHAPFRVPRLIPSFLENSNIAFTSFGKQSPPNPNLPSGPGTYICECPILPSLTKPSTAVSQSTSHLSATSFISFINATFAEKKQLFIYLIISAVS